MRHTPLLALGIIGLSALPAAAADISGHVIFHNTGGGDLAVERTEVTCMVRSGGASYSVDAGTSLQTPLLMTNLTTARACEGFGKIGYRLSRGGEAVGTVTVTVQVDGYGGQFRATVDGTGLTARPVGGNTYRITAK